MQGAASFAPLRLHCFIPRDSAPSKAVLLFHGGGWTKGSASQFFSQCGALASAGTLAASADYLLLGSGASSLGACVTDVAATIRTFSLVVASFGVPASGVVAGGASAGGHLVLAAVLASDRLEPPVVGGLVFMNPVLDLCCSDPVEALRAVADCTPDLAAASPVHLVRSGMPPTVVFQGVDDDITPVGHARRFRDAMVSAGNRCELVEFDGAGHGFFNPPDWPYGAGRPSDGSWYHQTVVKAVSFIEDLPS